jgi:hypothetical protein
VFSWNNHINYDVIVQIIRIARLHRDGMPEEGGQKTEGQRTEIAVPVADVISNTLEGINSRERSFPVRIKIAPCG